MFSPVVTVSIAREIGTIAVGGGSTALNMKIVGIDDEASVSEGAVDKTVAGRLAIVKLNVHFMDSTSGI